MMRIGALAAMLVIVASCRRDDDGLAPAPPATPEILAASARLNTDNVLSIVVTARVRLADSLAVRFGTSPALDDLTPAVVARGDSTVVPVLGLLPATRYILRVIAYSGAQVTLGESLILTTDTLPSDLPRYAASGSDPSPGYVVFAAGSYGLVIDNTGRVVWYHRFAGGPGLNFEAEPTGHYFARPATADPNDRDPWVEIDPLGKVTRILGCAGDLEPRFHDLIAESDGAYWIMCDDVRTMDLSRLGGKRNAQVTGTAIQHVSASGALLFQWTPFDHFDIADLDSATRSASNVNWTHGNSIDLDADGNVVASFRSLSELTKIDTRTGAVIWRMGGVRNQFRFADGSTPSFVYQHALRLTAPGQLLILDNLGDPSTSSVQRYAYNGATHAAQLIESYRPTPAAISAAGGSAQDLSGGRTLVSFGPAGRVEEFDASGRVMWRIEGNAGYVFRAQRIRSLYAPGAGASR